MAADPTTLADDAAIAALDVLNALRKEVLASILATREPFSATYRELLREVNALIVSFQRQLTHTMTRHVDTAANAGDAAVLDDAQAAGLDVPLSYSGVSPTLVRTASEYSASLITGLTDEARNAITRAVRLAALGGMDTTTLIDRIGRNLSDASVFTSLSARAEAIARTEVSRVYSMSKHDQATELAARYPGMKKVWQHSTSAPRASAHQRSTARANHVRLSEETNASPIPFEQDFDLGDFTARYPHDPLLPASEVVNCRCVLRLVAPN